MGDTSQAFTSAWEATKAAGERGNQAAVLQNMQKCELWRVFLLNFPLSPVKLYASISLSKSGKSINSNIHWVLSVCQKQLLVAHLIEAE